MRKSFYLEKYLMDNDILTKDQALDLMVERIKKGPIFEEVALKMNFIDQHSLLQILKLKYHFKGLSAEEIALHNKMIDKEQMVKIKDEILEHLPRAESILEKSSKIDKKVLEEAVKKTDGRVDEIDKRGTDLKRLQTFSKLSQRDLFDLADLAVCKSFSKGDKIIEDGGQADHFYFLSKGDVKVTKPNEDPEKPDIFITTISSPEIFGESSIFEEEKRKAHVVSENDVEVYQFDRMDFLAFLNSHLEASLPILLDIVQRLLKRIGDTNRELAFERKDFVDQSSVDDLLEQLLP